MKTLSARLHPGQDLVEALQQMATEARFDAAVLLSVVGSLTQARLRTGTGEVLLVDGPLEIVSGTGTLSHDSLHIHISVASADGRCMGGHLVSGCLINTTCEVVVANLSEEWVFERHQDDNTGYKELVVRKR